MSTNEGLYIEVYECFCGWQGIHVHTTLDGPKPVALCPECKHLMIVVTNSAKRQEIVNEAKKTLLSQALESLDEDWSAIQEVKR